MAAVDLSAAHAGGHPAGDPRPPAACHIHPVAAHTFVSHDPAAKPLIQALRAFDEAFAVWVQEPP
ncbi:MAG: hypothetical protein ABWU16_03470 [Halothiobacillaceae bacterium]